ncbi:MAG TPA: hypothetical protein VH877_29300 [Polyangia bacterium]|jgi:hypothetical protein|nr:hypothetical protein [Polyangia bacterium]
MRKRRLALWLALGLGGLLLGSGVALGNAFLLEGRALKKWWKEQDKLPPKPDPPPPPPSERQRQVASVIAIVKEVCTVLKQPVVHSREIAERFGTVVSYNPEFSVPFQPHHPLLRHRDPDLDAEVWASGNPNWVARVNFYMAEEGALTLADFEQAFGPGRVTFDNGIVQANIDFDWELSYEGPLHCQVGIHVSPLDLIEVGGHALYDRETGQIDPRLHRDLVPAKEVYVERGKKDAEGYLWPAESNPPEVPHPSTALPQNRPVLR